MGGFNKTTSGSRSLYVDDLTIGTVSITQQYSTVPYKIQLPPTQGAANSILTNDGQGLLTWRTETSLPYVTQVGLTAPAFLTVTNSPITPTSLSPTLALSLSGTALPISSGGTGLITVGTTGKIFTSNGATASWETPSVATVTGVLPIANGGTGTTAATGTGDVVLNTSPTITAATLTGGTTINGGTGTTGWTYIMGNANGNANPTSSTTGFALSWNPSGGDGDNAITYYTGAGASPRLDICSWNGTTRTARLSINSTGAVTFGSNTYPNSTGTNGQVLTSNGAGTVTWQTPPGSVTSVGLSVPGGGFLQVNGTTSATITTTGVFSLSLGVLPIGNGGTGATSATGTGDVVLKTSPTLTSPTLNTPTLNTPSISSPNFTNSVAINQNVAINNHNFTVDHTSGGETNFILADAGKFTITSNSSSLTSFEAITFNMVGFSTYSILSSGAGLINLTSSGAGAITLASSGTGAIFLKTSGVGAIQLQTTGAGNVDLSTTGTGSIGLTAVGIGAINLSAKIIPASPTEAAFIMDATTGSIVLRSNVPATGNIAIQALAGTVSMTGTGTATISSGVSASLTGGTTASLTAGTVATVTGATSAVLTSATATTITSPFNTISGASTSISSASTNLTGASITLSGATTLISSATTNLTGAAITLSGAATVITSATTSLTGAAITLSGAVTAITSAATNLTGAAITLSGAATTITSAATLLSGAATTITSAAISLTGATTAVTGAFVHTGNVFTSTVPGAGVTAITTAGAGTINLSTVGGQINLLCGAGGINVTVAEIGTVYIASTLGECKMLTTGGNCEITSGAGTTKVTSDTGNVILSSNAGAINVIASQGGLNLGTGTTSGADRLCRIAVTTSNGSGFYEEGDVSFQTVGRSGTLGPFSGSCNFTVDTTIGYTGRIAHWSKGNFEIASNLNGASIATKTVNLNTSFLTGSYSFNFPITSGTTGQVFTSGGPSNAISWTNTTGLDNLVRQRDPDFKNSVNLYDTTGAGSFVSIYPSQVMPAPYAITLPPDSGTAGQVLTTSGAAGILSWAAPTTSGTVTSVAVTVPSILAVSGSPITSSGTIAITLGSGALPIANGGTASTTATGTGSVVLQNAPTFAASITVPLIVGSGVSGDLTLLSARNIYLTASTTVTIGSNTYPNSTGSNGQILTTNGAGTLSWASPATSGTVTSVTVASGNSFLTVTNPTVTSSGTITISLNGPLTTNFGGTGSTDASTGTGGVVLGIDPQFTTQLRTPKVVGSGTSGDLTLQSARNVIINSSGATYVNSSLYAGGSIICNTGGDMNITNSNSFIFLNPGYSVRTGGLSFHQESAPNQTFTGTSTGDSTIRSDASLWLGSTIGGTSVRLTAPSGCYINGSLYAGGNIICNTGGDMNITNSNSFIFLNPGYSVRTQGMSLHQESANNQTYPGTVTGDSTLRADSNLWIGPDTSGKKLNLYALGGCFADGYRLGNVGFAMYGGATNQNPGENTYIAPTLINRSGAYLSYSTSTGRYTNSLGFDVLVTASYSLQLALISPPTAYYMIKLNSSGAQKFALNQVAGGDWSSGSSSFLLTNGSYFEFVVNNTGVSTAVSDSLCTVAYHTRPY